MTPSDEELWRAAARETDVHFEPEALLAALRARARRLDRGLRWGELCDFWTGIALLLVLAVAFARAPELLRAAPPGAVVGGVILLMAYAAYHVQGFRARVAPTGATVSLADQLQADIVGVDRRIGLLAGAWFHAPAAAVGGALLVHALCDSPAWQAALDIAIAAFAAAMLWLAVRAIRRVYAPWGASLRGRLAALSRPE